MNPDYERQSDLLLDILCDYEIGGRRAYSVLTRARRHFEAVVSTPTPLPKGPGSAIARVSHENFTRFAEWYRSHYCVIAAKARY